MYLLDDNGVTPQKTVMFIVSARRTSDLTKMGALLYFSSFVVPSYIDGMVAFVDH